MLQIGICDDGKKIGDYIEAIRKSGRADIRILRFPTEESLAEAQEMPDVLFFQVEKKVFDGILKSVAKEGGENRKAALMIKIGTACRSVPIEEIMYAENNGRKIILHTKQETFEFYGKMNDLEEELGQAFFRCHRGYLVALSYVTGYDSGNVYLKNGESIYLAKRKYSEFARAYRNFVKNAGL